MAKPHRRPPPQPPRTELIEIRRKKFPNLLQRDFATLLGVTRLHVTSIEYGRRQASLELALKWLELLAPEAKLEMFGDIPAVAVVKKFQELTQKKAA